ncbi:MAG: carboxypeptidase regulatory-like domain-containing protein [Bryobacterales bacterium]|nr:carboxypeptidase regulatory-like domain-containing protein [Bryobacterales bacterium]
MMFARMSVASTLSAITAFASECRVPTICELISREWTTAFVGEVISGGVDSPVVDPTRASAGAIRVRVVERLAGVPKGVSEFTFLGQPYSDLSCSGTLFVTGRRYLIMSWGRITATDSPSVVRPLKHLGDADLPLLREYFAGRHVPQIQGHVVATGFDSDMVKVLLLMKEAKPVAGAVVSARSATGQRYSARTDSEGRYLLPLPSGGRYTMNISRPPYRAGAENPADVPSHGCATRNFALHSGNQLAGSVLGATEHALDQQVRLIDLDHPWKATNYLRGSSFLFKDVPLGRYLLALANSDVLWTQPFKGFFTNSFYPGRATRRSARTIELTSGGVHLRNLNLTVGTPVPTRPVRIRIAARVAGGETLDTLTAEVEAVPRSEDDLPWTSRRFVPDNPEGWLELRAPADRRLKIKAVDWFNRTAPGEYESTHEPGHTPIEVEFVIKDRAKRR